VVLAVMEFQAVVVLEILQQQALPLLAVVVQGLQVVVLDALVNQVVAVLVVMAVMELTF
jgi:hypothetical protein